MNATAKIYKDILRSKCTARRPGFYSWAEVRSMGNPLGPRIMGEHEALSPASGLCAWQLPGMSTLGGGPGGVGKVVGHSEREGNE